MSFFVCTISFFPDAAFCTPTNILVHRVRGSSRALNSKWGWSLEYSRCSCLSRGVASLGTSLPMRSRVYTWNVTSSGIWQPAGSTRARALAGWAREMAVLRLTYEWGVGCLHLLGFLPAKDGLVLLRGLLLRDDRGSIAARARGPLPLLQFRHGAIEIVEALVKRGGCWRGLVVRRSLWSEPFVRKAGVGQRKNRVEPSDWTAVD